MMTLTQTSATQGQLKQITRVGTDAIEKVLEELGLDKDGAQRVHEHGDEFAAVIREAAKASLLDLSVSDKFKNEEVGSNYRYLSGYQPKNITEQCDKLRVLFPGIGYASNDFLARVEKNEVELPKHAEGWFAIPNWKKNPAIFGSTYAEALLKVLTVIKETRRGKFYNYREGQITEHRLRQSARTEKFFADLTEAQGNPDILIVPAQFGLRHRGRSVRRAREVFAANEFGLGAFAAGIMILTHPERLMHFDDLWIDCAGDEFDDPGSDVRFGRAPYFRFSGGKVEFDAYWVSDASEHCGSASGFGSQ